MELKHVVLSTGYRRHTPNQGDRAAQIDGPIGEELVVMRREGRVRILVDGPNRYNQMAANCEDVTVKHVLEAPTLHKQT